MRNGTRFMNSTLLDMLLPGMPGGADGGRRGRGTGGEEDGPPTLHNPMAMVPHDAASMGDGGPGAAVQMPIGMFVASQEPPVSFDQTIGSGRPQSRVLDSSQPYSQGIMSQGCVVGTAISLTLCVRACVRLCLCVYVFMLLVCFGVCVRVRVRACVCI